MKIKKKVIGVAAICLASIISITTVQAKGLYDVTLYGRDTVKAILYDTEAKFHTSIVATYKNEPEISVENTVQRKNSAGNWVNRGQVYPLVKEINKAYEYNFSLGGAGNTRAIWVNVSNGTTIKGNLYIDNGHV